MIEVSNLNRVYGSFQAVEDCSFAINRGEVVGLLGHNGAGKTTIMKMLTGFLEPTSGTIHIDGLALGRETTSIQGRIGYLPENCPVWPEMTVMAYLEYHADLRGLSELEKPRAIARAIRRTALKEKALDTISTLSRGYRQRVGVAQAILHNPDIIILDEPTNGLDPTQIRQMRDLIRELAQDATVILSTHILQEVQAVCERVLILNQGKLAVDATLDELQQGGKLRLTTTEDAQAALVKVPHIRKIEILPASTNQHHYAITTTADNAPNIAQAVVEANLGLHSLYFEKQDLESLFAQVSQLNQTALQESSHG
ncbi:ABC transporter ATP-binding protein [Magnetococcus sp. PR-3]|uniref:ABC transporter ATP-binding protein n=1 Tax=Magnetococcus sp. PR-3 TaxID=3120355 RepID=UPI002FCE46AE